LFLNINKFQAIKGFHRIYEYPKLFLNIHTFQAIAFSKLTFGIAFSKLTCGIAVNLTGELIVHHVVITNGAVVE